MTCCTTRTHILFLHLLSSSFFPTPLFFSWPPLPSLLTSPSLMGHRERKMGGLTHAVSSPFELGAMHSDLDISCSHLVLGDPNPTCECLPSPINSKGVITCSWTPPQCPQAARDQCRAPCGISPWLGCPPARHRSCLLAGKCNSLPPPFHRSPLGGMGPARWVSGSDALAALLHLSALSISLCCWLCSSQLDLSPRPSRFNLQVASKEFPKACGDSGADADSTAAV